MKQMGLAQFCKRRNPHEPVSEGGDAPNLAFLAGSAASAVGLDDSTSRAVANEVSAASSTRAGKGKFFFPRGADLAPVQFDVEQKKSSLRLSYTSYNNTKKKKKKHHPPAQALR